VQTSWHWVHFLARTCDKVNWDEVAKGPYFWFLSNTDSLRSLTSPTKRPDFGFCLKLYQYETRNNTNYCCVQRQQQGRCQAAATATPLYSPHQGPHLQLLPAPLHPLGLAFNPPAHPSHLPALPLTSLAAVTVFLLLIMMAGVMMMKMMALHLRYWTCCPMQHLHHDAAASLVGIHQTTLSAHSTHLKSYQTPTGRLRS